ncbi:hypothetical protein PF005_g10451 [Phytophthora fragariae]|uniref:Uncharacterized protein n=1 Tax=Phytophthora fragariae TaxID=53985 RepID=A0A6A3Y5Y2_9STRA|nr:hypothetical protein PF011_g10827 [Phytophthora fragariae]KAE9203876.1 hypothetical protein PF002_g20809 [Phytophthora fragariae]KAE9212765.1 hypothetical protein PF005_g10451 [Phytophthora fragariae]
MKKWHALINTVQKLEKALGWMKQLQFARVDNRSFQVEENLELPVVLKNIPLISNKAQVLDLTAKECLSDDQEVWH